MNMFRTRFAIKGSSYGKVRQNPNKEMPQV